MSLIYNGDAVVTSIGARYRSVFTVGLDNNYPSGGYTLDPAKVGLERIESASVANIQNGYLFAVSSNAWKLAAYTGSGGGGPLIFSGNPMGPHNHTISRTTENLSASANYTMLIGSATGFFVFGETITGGSSGATATVTIGNSEATGDLSIAPTLGLFQVGETITGGTSGVTATVATTMYNVYTPSDTPVLLEGAARTSVTGLSYFPTANDVNPDLVVNYGTLVGLFADFEVVTGGSSGATMIVNQRNSGQLVGAITYFGGSGGGFLLGETITGGTSGATAVVTQASFTNSIVLRPTSTSSPTGDFIMFYPNCVNASPLRVTYLAATGNDSITAGTPAGTITGGGSGTIVEVSPGTDMSSITSLQVTLIGW